MSNAELYAQYQSTGYIPDDNPINTTTTFNTSSGGSVVVWNPSSGAGGFLGGDGSSMQAVGGVAVSGSAANPAPLVIGGKTYNPEDSFSYQAAGGVEVNCTAAATAAGYGRTCTSSNIDGSVTTTSASGMIGLNAQGELFGTGGETGIGGRGITNGNTGPIDHGDCGQGTQNVACAPSNSPPAKCRSTRYLKHTTSLRGHWSWEYLHTSRFRGILLREVKVSVPNTLTVVIPVPEELTL